MGWWTHLGKSCKSRFGQEKKLSLVLEDDCDDHHNHSDDEDYAGGTMTLNDPTAGFGSQADATKDLSSQFTGDNLIAALRIWWPRLQSSTQEWLRRCTYDENGGRFNHVPGGIIYHCVTFTYATNPFH